jgi:hypothetical protein
MPEYPTHGPLDVEVSVGAGVVELSTADTDRATVEVTPYDDSSASRDAAEATQVSLTGDHLVIHAPDVGSGWLFRRSPRLRVRATVPTGSRLNTHIASADLRCDGDFGSSRLSTASGDMYLRSCAGDLRAHSASGGVLVDRVTGDANLRSASGEITIGSAGGEVSASTASGDIEIGDAAGSVRARTASGDVRVGGARHGGVEVDTASGDALVGVVPGTRVWLDLSSLSGATRSDLAASDAGPAADGDVPAALTVRLRSLSGNVHVYRTPQTAGDPA